MRTSRISFIHIFLYLGKFFIPIRLIGHRPKQDRRMITIKMNRLHIRLEYIRIVLAILIIECFPIFIGMMSHPANRRFYFDKHSQFITDIQHFLTRRIMWSTDKITIGGTIKFNILSLPHCIHDTPRQRVHLMPAYPPQLNGASVYKQLVSTDFYLTKAKTFLHGFYHFVI